MNADMTAWNKCMFENGFKDKALAGLMKRAGDSFYGRWAARQRSGR